VSSNKGAKVQPGVRKTLEFFPRGHPLHLLSRHPLWAAGAAHPQSSRRFRMGGRPWGYAGGPGPMRRTIKGRKNVSMKSSENSGCGTKGVSVKLVYLICPPPMSLV